jgi:K+-sensing histidine kinase KdpD
MAENPSKFANPQPNSAQALARILRHELGDLLQTIYATVAILQERLPADAGLERRILTDLRRRAGTCKELLDNVQDYVAPLELEHELVDMADVLSAQAAHAGARYPKVVVDVQVPPDLPGVSGDPRRLAQIAALLLQVACESAENRVDCQVALKTSMKDLECTVVAEGKPLPDADQQELFDPFPQNRYSHRGLHLALARRLVEAHGGRVTGEAPPAGGIRLAVVLPLGRTNNFS